MDDADYAANEEEALRQQALRKTLKPLLKRGSCYHCGERCDHFFCDVDCRRDYEKENFVKRKTQRD